MPEFPIGGLWPQIVSPEGLYAAYLRARLGKRYRPEVAGFSLRLEPQLHALRRSLRDGSYRPGPFRTFTIYERKPRVISAAPFRDRVVHHALMNAVEPIIDPTFHPGSFACRAGKGVHAAIDRYQRFARRYAYVMKLDIRRYFPSVDHAILEAQLARRLAEPEVRALFHWIIASWHDPEDAYVLHPGDDLLTPLTRPRGLPIGNLTSQFLANLYLDDFDHEVAADPRTGGYIRYVDDMVLFADSKTDLWALRERITELLGDLRLRLHPDKVFVTRTVCKVDFLGYQLTGRRRWLRPDSGRRFERRLRGMAAAYRRGEASLEDIRPSLQGWLGHARHGESTGLRRQIFKRIVMVKGAGRA